MANITRFDPFNEMTRLNPFGDMDNLFRGFALRPVFQGMPSSSQMKLDISEDDKSYTIKADIPGVKKEDIRITVDGNQVSITAEMKKETEKKEGKTVVHSERYYGQIMRSFTLDKEVDEGAAKAKYSDGVLEVVLPKRKGAKEKAKAISIS